jgi:tetratricopeptide (TPR) repeat protein
MAELRRKNPFVGPRPFDRAHRSLFFGRESELSELVSLILSSPVVLLYAPSGAGKSSLINAAVIPALEHKEGFEVFPVARLRGPVPDDPTPSDGGNVYVASVMSNWVKELSDRKMKRAPAPGPRGPAPPKASEPPRPPGPRRPPDARPTSEPTTLSSFLKERRHLIGTDGEPAPRAIFFDQFEEIITAYPEHWRQREGFFRQVAEALEKDDLLRVVFAVREDFVGTIQPFARLLPDGFRTHFRLERLSPDSALEAIEGPLDKTERSFAPGVAQSLVSDLLKFRVDTGFGERMEVDGEHVEPVQLQVVCRTLWSELDPEVSEISEEHRLRYGNVDRALSRFYAKAIGAAAERTGIEEKELRRWFETFFITSMNTRGTVYRTPGSTAGMPNAVIEELESRHLIHAEWRARARWYEISHDRLIGPILSSNHEFFRGPAAPEDDLVLKASFALARAESALSEGKSDEALKAAEEALEIYREADDVAGQATAYMKLSEIQFERSSLDEALELVESACRIYRERNDEIGMAEAFRGIGQIHRERDELDSAFDHFQRSLEISQKRADPVSATRTLVVLIDLLLSVGRYDDAEIRAKEGLQLAESTENPVLAANMVDYLGLVHFHTDRPEAARELWTDACDRYGALGDSYGSAVMHENVGQLDMWKGNVDDALAHFSGAVLRYEEAQEIVSAARVQSRVAEANWYLGRLEQALEGFDRGLLLDPGSASLHSGRGQVLAHLARYEEALEELDTALGLAGGEQPLEAYVHSGRGLALSGLGRHDEALAELETAVHAAPGNAWAYLNRAIAHVQAGDREHAGVDVARALEVQDPPLSPWLHARAEEMLASVAKA